MEQGSSPNPAATEGAIVDEVEEVQILTQTSPLEAGPIEFQWTAPLEPKEGSVIFSVASNSSNANSPPTGDAINELEVSIPAGMTEKLYYAQFANGGVLEVIPSNGQVAATVLRSSPGNLASLPVAPIR